MPDDSRDQAGGAAYLRRDLRTTMQAGGVRMYSPNVRHPLDANYYGATVPGPSTA